MSDTGADVERQVDVSETQDMQVDARHRSKRGEVRRSMSDTGADVDKQVGVSETQDMQVDARHRSRLIRHRSMSET
jgi:hypothetical protein